ncbi:MAG TPA: tRNA lysidine(34) synthetase TilS [Acidobacteriota bacterium]|jgi:tRNA(Ile)-lysidine synthase
MVDLRAQILNTIRRHKLLKPGDRVLLAVSGGADSVALLRVMCDLRRDLGLVLSVAHLDHKIRPRSNEDAEFVRDLSSSRELPFFSAEADIPAILARSGGNLEQVARRRRIAFLQATARKGRFQRIATGHTLDDQAETVLMKLLRGSGATGLGGIAPRKGRWIRPLIETARSDILDYLGGLAQGFCDDATNRDSNYMRNRIRHELLPLLRSRYSSAVVKRLSTLADIERETERFWQHYCRRWVCQDEGGAFLPLDLRNCPVAEQREAIRLFLSTVRGNLRRLAFVHIEAVRRLLAPDAGGKKVLLPGGWEIEQRFGAVRSKKL